MLANGVGYAKVVAVGIQVVVGGCHTLGGITREPFLGNDPVGGKAGSVDENILGLDGYARIGRIHVYALKRHTACPAVAGCPFSAGGFGKWRHNARNVAEPFIKQEIAGAINAHGWPAILVNVQNAIIVIIQIINVGNEIAVIVLPGRDGGDGNGYGSQARPRTLHRSSVVTDGILECCIPGKADGWRESKLASGTYDQRALDGSRQDYLAGEVGQVGDDETVAIRIAVGYAIGQYVAVQYLSRLYGVGVVGGYRRGCVNH